MSIIRVASLAGVSKSTVSRVINRSPGVGPESAAAVRRAMRQLGYQPSPGRPGPKPLSRRGIRTGNVVLLAMGKRAEELYRLPVFPALLHGAERALSEQGLNLILANVDPGGALPGSVSESQADGLLLWGKWDPMPSAVRARLRQMAAVWVLRAHSDEEADFDHVFYNNAAVGRVAARYLLSRGHKDVAFISGSPSHPAFGERERVFVDVVTAASCNASVIVSDAEAVDGGSGLTKYRALIERLGALSPRPTGLFVPNDAQLSSLYDALELSRLRPGRDLEIIGCDNEQEIVASLTPRPATIDIHLQLVGKRAVQQLLLRMRHPGETTRVTTLIEPSLVPGDANPVLDGGGH